MSSKETRKTKLYYFIDVHLQSRKIIGWGIEPREAVEVQLTKGFHRVFLSKGQYNKLERSIAIS